MRQGWGGRPVEQKAARGDLAGGARNAGGAPWLRRGQAGFVGDVRIDVVQPGPDLIDLGRPLLVRKAEVGSRDHYRRS